GRGTGGEAVAKKTPPSSQKKDTSNLETRPSLLQELRSFEKGGFFDFGHPLLNRIAESFLKAAGIGAIQAVSREAYFTATEGLDSSGGGIPPEISGNKKHRFPDLRGENNTKSLEAMVKHTGKESLQWGLAAGVYSGLTYGLTEARGAHDWVMNRYFYGACVKFDAEKQCSCRSDYGVALALTSEGSSHEQIVQGAITGAAISTAANLLSGIF
ncbi:Mitochondrial import inner membrane translocase subunit Tim17/Tim22/Tim23 family protein, partial [Prunus dulcis]